MSSVSRGIKLRGLLLSMKRARFYLTLEKDERQTLKNKTTWRFSAEKQLTCCWKIQHICFVQRPNVHSVGNQNAVAQL